MYPEQFVTPMREELTRVGFREMRSAADVDSTLKDENRTVLVVVNSVCGCAAGKARPAIVHALASGPKPEILATVFAGQDQEATAQARSYFTGYAPSSPSVALLRDGKVAFMLERRDIESSDAFSIAKNLKQAFEKFCTPAGAAKS
jgi:putative YphP/YqiW family bacilliredoxin